MIPFSVFTGMMVAQPVTHSHEITAIAGHNHPTIQSIPKWTKVLSYFLFSFFWLGQEAVSLG